MKNYEIYKDIKLYSSLSIESESMMKFLKVMLDQMFGVNSDTSCDTDICESVLNFLPKSSISKSAIQSLITFSIKQKHTPIEYVVLLNNYITMQAQIKSMMKKNLCNLFADCNVALKSNTETFDSSRYIKFEENMDFEDLINSLTGPEQKMRPAVLLYGCYNYFPVECKGYCSAFCDKILKKIEQFNKSIYSDITKDHANLESFQVDFVKSCLFSHNAQEQLYHPLLMKSEYCRNKYCKMEDPKCRYAHSRNELQIKGLLSNDSIDSIENLVRQFEIFRHDKLRDFMNSNPVLKLNHQFKIAKCIYKGCKDTISCIYYHNKYERRRPNVSINKICPNVQANEKWLDPKLCKEADLCEYFHTKNEVLYDYRNYRKLYACPYELENGVCIRGSICYYKHVTDTNYRRIGLEDLYLISILEREKMKVKKDIGL